VLSELQLSLILASVQGVSQEQLHRPSQTHGRWAGDKKQWLLAKSTLTECWGAAAIDRLSSEHLREIQEIGMWMRLLAYVSCNAATPLASDLQLGHGRIHGGSTKLNFNAATHASASDRNE